MCDVVQMPFTYASYEKMLKALKKKEFQFVDYSSFRNQSGRTVILRHDVDFDPMKCRRIAEIEQAENVSSTFFFLIRSDFYNIFSSQVSNLIQSVGNMGHTVGLHFDETVYSDSVDYVQAIKNEAAILEDIAGKRVDCVSMHLPSKKCLDGNWIIPGIENSYSHEIFSNYEYISDSRRRWKKPVMDIIENCSLSAPRKLHILTHPIWYHEKESDLRIDVNSLAQSAKEERLFALSQNISNPGECIAVEDIYSAAIHVIRRQKFTLDRVSLRQLCLSDASDMFEYASNQKVCRFLQWGPYKDISEAEDWLKSRVEGSDYKDILFGIELNEESKLIGVVRIYSLDAKKQQAEISYILNPKYSGRGLATEAIGGAIDIACDALRLKRIIATIDFENEGSINLAQRLGFEYVPGKDFTIGIKGTPRQHRTFEYEREV